MSEYQLPDLPDGWEWGLLSDLAAVEDGAITDGPFGSKLKTEHYTSSGPRVIRLQNIGDGGFLDAHAHISAEHFETLRKHEARTGDIVIAALGETLPRACLVPEALGPAIVKADCPRLRPHPSLNSQYLVYALNSPVVRGQAKALLHGLGRPRLNMSEVKSLRLPLPPRAEQDRIVLRLDALLARTETGAPAFRRAAADVAQFRAAALAAAFSGDATGIRPTITALDDLAEIQSGIAKGRQLDGSTAELPYICTANVQAGFLDMTVIKTLFVTPEQRARHLLQPGDVLVLEGGDADKVGRGWLWQGEIEECLHQNHVFAVRPDHDRLLPRYLAYYVNSPQARQYFRSCAKQVVNLASINKRQLKALPVPHMDLDAQKRVVELLDEQLGAAAGFDRGLREALALADELRRSVLHRAVVGRLSEQVSADEPSGVLLERIRQARAATTKTKKPGRKATVA
jgi:type I restriction enzyme S subunit